MADYIVSCESAADLSPEWMEKRGLKYICFTFSLNGKEYKDDLWVDAGDGQGFEAVELCRCSEFAVEDEAAVVVEVLKYGVAACQRGFGVQARVIGTGGLEEADERGSLFVIQAVGGDAEIGAGSSLDAEAVGTEIDGIEVHSENLFFRIGHLELDGHDPFLGLHDEDLQARNVAEEARGVLCADIEEVLGQLLGDGAGASCATASDVLGGGEEADNIDAVVAVETFILGGHECADNDGANVLVADGASVLAEITPDEDAVGAVYLAGLVGRGAFDLPHAGRASEEPEKVDIDGTEEEHQSHKCRTRPDGETTVPGAGEEVLPQGRFPGRGEV